MCARLSYVFFDTKVNDRCFRGGGWLDGAHGEAADRHDRRGVLPDPRRPRRTRSEVGRVTGLSRTAVAARSEPFSSRAGRRGSRTDRARLDRRASAGPAAVQPQRGRRTRRGDRAQSHPARGLRPRRGGARDARPRPGGGGRPRRPDAEAGRGLHRAARRSRTSRRRRTRGRAVHPRHGGPRPRSEPGLAGHVGLGRCRAGSVPAGC